MKHLRFSCDYTGYSQDAENEGEVKRLGMMHPQKAMSAMGITYQHATPQSMGGQWWFWNCENIPEVLPPFLTVLDLQPMKCVGFGLSLENAKMIDEYSTRT